MTIKPDFDPRPAAQLPPPLERGGSGEGIAGRRRGARGALANPSPQACPEEGEGVRAPSVDTMDRSIAAAFSPAASPRWPRAARWPRTDIRLAAVTIAVPFPAGAVTDATARLMVDHLATAFGQSFVVENRGGGGGIPGAVTVARAQPNGATRARDQDHPFGGAGALQVGAL